MEGYSVCECVTRFITIWIIKMKWVCNGFTVVCIMSINVYLTGPEEWVRLIGI